MQTAFITVTRAYRQSLTSRHLESTADRVLHIAALHVVLKTFIPFGDRGGSQYLTEALRQIHILKLRSFTKQGCHLLRCETCQSATYLRHQETQVWLRCCKLDKPFDVHRNIG